MLGEPISNPPEEVVIGAPTGSDRTHLRRSTVSNNEHTDNGTNGNIKAHRNNRDFSPRSSSRRCDDVDG